MLPVIDQKIESLIKRPDFQRFFDGDQSFRIRSVHEQKMQEVLTHPFLGR